MSKEIEKPATILLSGGLDSYACAHLLRSQYNNICAIFIDYGQAAVVQERCAAKKLARLLQMSITCITAKSDHVFASGELVGRNAFLITTAVFLGRAHEGVLALGIHAGTPYYDCSVAFLNKMKRLTEEETNGCLTITAPFINWTKAQVHQYLTSNNLSLKTTYSCESGTVPPCGACASCRDREELGC